MSVQFQLFVKTESPLEEFVGGLNPILASVLIKDSSVDWEVYRGVLLGVEISLFEAKDFEDDRQLKFSLYDYVIDIDWIPGLVDRTFARDWQKSISITVANIASKRLKCECLVVENMQSLICEFIPDPA